MEIGRQVVEAQHLLEFEHRTGVLALGQIGLATFEVGGDRVRIRPA